MKKSQNSSIDSSLEQRVKPQHLTINVPVINDGIS
jgi:hypothetical protein